MTTHGTLVRLERRSDGIALITIDNPPVNALTTPVFTELLAIANELRAAPPRAVVLAGQAKVFALGGEISETRRIRFEGRTDIGDDELDAAVQDIMDPDYVRELGSKYLATFDALAHLPCAVVAAIQGIAFGGGLELALACDYRIASERARLGSPEVTLGGGTIGGGLFRMTRLIGPSLAKKMYLTGAPVTAAQALAIGLVDEVVPPEALLQRALEMALEFAEHAGPAQAGMKQLIDTGHDLSEEEAGQAELEAWCASYATDDARARLRKFLAHGPAAPRQRG
jgi:enoyl-CoA hydratase/carnithine racemase